MPFVVNLRRDFRGLDFGAPTPENIGVGNGDSDGRKMSVNGGLVFEDAGLFGAMHHPHDIHVSELWTTLAPIRVSHAEMAADLATGFHFAAFRHGPVEQPVEAGDALAGGGWLHVFEESGKTADNLFRIERLGDFTKPVESHTCDFRAFVPRVFANFIHGELFFQGEQDLPFFGSEIDHGSCHHNGGFVRFIPGCEDFPAGVADAEGEDAVGGHEQVFGGAGQSKQSGGVEIQGFADRHLERGPQPVAGAGNFRVCRADHHVPGKRVFLRHEIKRRIEFFLRHLPCDERTVGKLGGEQRLADLADPADDSGLDHRPDPLQHRFQRQSGLLGDDLKGKPLEPGDEILGNRQDRGIGRVGVFDRDGGIHGRINDGESVAVRCRI